MSMTLISTATVTGSAADIQFSNIPQIYTDLYVLLSVAGRLTVGTDGAIVAYTELNQSNSLSSWRNLFGNGSGVSSGNTAYPIVGTVQYVAGTNTFGSTVINIPNYTSSNQKVFSYDTVTENNGTVAYQGIGALRINYTPPITFLGFGDGSAGGGFRVGSTISLYGITRGTGGATVS
jgi:hypothetical protein